MKQGRLVVKAKDEKAESVYENKGLVGRPTVRTHPALTGSVAARIRKKRPHTLGVHRHQHHSAVPVALHEASGAPHSQAMQHGLHIQARRH